MDRPARKNSVAFLSSLSAEPFSVLDYVRVGGFGVCSVLFVGGSTVQLGMCGWHGCLLGALPHPQRFLPPTQHAWACGKCVVSKRKRFGAVGHSVLVWARLADKSWLKVLSTDLM